MGFTEIIQMVVLAGIGFFIWSAVVSKDWNFLIGLGALFIVPLSAILISTYPLVGFCVVYALWFGLLFSSRDKVAGPEESPQSIGSVAWKAAQYALVTVLIAFALNAFFGGVGGSGGGCSRATPQFC